MDVLNGPATNLTISGGTVNGLTNLNVLTNAVAVFDANQVLTNSPVTAQELSYLSGLTNALSTELAGKVGTNEFAVSLADVRAQQGDSNKVENVNGAATNL